jgi:phosphatidylglycerophosphate synthase
MAKPAAVSAWVDGHALAMLVAGLVGAVLETAAPIVLTGVVSFAVFGYRSRRSLAKLRPLGGYANWLTTLRLVMVLGVAATMAQLPQLLVLLAFTANVGIDSADGYVARRARQITQFGAALDREVDAIFVLTAYEYFYLVQGFGAWVLLPGLLPYFYRVVTRQLSAAPDRDEKQRLAAVLAGVNFGLLLAAVASPPRLQPVALVASIGIVTLSFAASSWKLYRNEYSVP